MVLKRGQKKSAKERAERREEVRGYMETIGPFSIPAQVLAEKHGVTKDTIFDDRDFWIRKISFKKMDEFGKRVIMSIMKNLELTEEIRIKGSYSDRLRAMGVSNQTAEVVTKLLENYGFKEKVAEKIEHEGIRIMIKRADDGKNKVEGRDMGTKPKARNGTGRSE